MIWKPKTKKAPWVEAFPEQRLISSSPLKRVSPISERQRARLERYRVIAREWLGRFENHWCAVCIRAFTLGEITLEEIQPSIEVHHRRGRAGNLLFDIRFFTGVCRCCHNLINDDRGWAKKEGWIESWHNSKG